MSVTWGLINSVPTAAFKNQRFVLAIKKQSKVVVAFVAALCPNVEYFLETFFHLHFNQGRMQLLQHQMI